MKYPSLLGRGRVVHGLGREGCELTHGTLMNGGCLWLLREESSFNMSLERGGKKASTEAV